MRRHPTPNPAEDARHLTAWRVNNLNGRPAMADTPDPVEGPETWEIESTIYKEFMASIYVPTRPRGKQYIAQVRAYADALLIARAPTMAAEIATLKARISDLEADAEDTERDAYADGQRDADGAAGDLWRGVIAFLTARKVTIHSDEGDGTHTAQEVADALSEEVGDLDRTITRLEAEKAELVAGLREIVSARAPHRVSIARSLLTKLEGGG